MTSATFTPVDYQHMAQALRLARRGSNSTRPNPAVGCVIAYGAAVVGEGWHKQAGGPHAEVHALQMAGAQAKGATAYVTLEPCSHTGKTGPCSQALIEAGVARVVAAIQDPNPAVAGQGLAQLSAAGIETRCGLLEAEAAQINAGFFKRMREGTPRVFTKLASSLDGRTAMASGESVWISGEAARADVQRLRASACAVLTGIGTVLADDPQLNVRDQRLLDQLPAQPVRVVLDSQLRCPADAKLFASSGRVVLLTTQAGYQQTEQLTALQAVGAEVVALADQQGQLGIQSVLQWLGQQQFNNVMVEAGAVLNGALLTAQAIDEIVLYQAMHLMGDGARGLFHLPAVTEMQQRIALQLKDCRQIGDDLRLTLKPSWS